MPRVVVLGCGTGVGKTRVSVALLRELRRAQAPCIGLKPVESGVAPNVGGPVTGSDARSLSEVSSLRSASPHPLYALQDPVSPHLAARAQGVEIELARIARWVSEAEADMARLVAQHRAVWTVIESAGGVFSPLSVRTTNYDLALALEPALWILVASDTLGVLHELSATLQAMRARGRVPDHVLLSAAREPDASTGRNAAELALLGIVSPTAVLTRDDDSGIRSLCDRLLSETQPPSSC